MDAAAGPPRAKKASGGSNGVSKLKLAKSFTRKPGAS